jgi:hypothetical protein
MVTNRFRKKNKSCTATRCLIIYLFLSVIFGSKNNFYNLQSGITQINNDELLKIV